MYLTFCKHRDSFGKVGVELVVYGSAELKDLAPYYSGLESLLADESEVNNLLKPLKVSRKSVTIRSASKCHYYARNIL